MNINNYKKLVKFYNSILDKKFDKYLLSINKLNIIKSHASYINFESNTKKISLLRKISKYFFFKEKIVNKKRNFLFLSTYVDEKKILNKDFYFSHIAQNIPKKDFFFIYRNFQIKNKNIKRENLIILSDKRFFFRDLYNFLKISYKLIFLKISHIFKKYENQKINELISIKSIKGALYNLSVVHEILNVIYTINPKKIFITFEGYPFERLLIKELKKKKNIIVYAYYFSIISKHQNYPLRFKDKSYNPDFIITSGEVAKNKIYKNGFNKKKLFNIGSNKINTIFTKNYNNSRKHVLLLPEAFENEVNLFIKFAIDCGKNSNIPFILRLHPAFEINDQLKKQINELKSETNFIISDKKLLFDLKRSNIAVYRGSSSVVEAINNNVYPVYLKIKKELSIDPLYEIEKIKFNSGSSEDFIKFYNNFSTNKIFTQNFIKIKKYNSKYFEKPNLKKIKNILFYENKKK